MVVAHARMETRLLLRNGEQVLLAVVIPLIVLVGGISAAQHFDLTFSHSAGRHAHPRGAGPRGDVDELHLPGDRDRLRAALRRPEAARHLAAPPLRPAARARSGALLLVEAVQVLDHRRRRAAARLVPDPVASSACSASSPRCCSARPPSPRSACSSPARCAPRRRWPSPTSSTCC